MKIRQLTRPCVISLLLGQAAIDDEPHSGDGYRGFGNVGREDDLAFVWRRRDERLGLLDGGQFGIQGQDRYLFPGCTSQRFGDLRWSTRARAHLSLVGHDLFEVGQVGSDRSGE